MRTKLILSMLTIILTCAQVWASPVDSLQIDPRTTSIPNNWNGLELTNSEVLANGFKPAGNLDVIDATSYTSSSDSWSSIPSTKTFKTSVGKPVSYTITLYESSEANSSGITMTKFDAQLDDATGMYTLLKQTGDEEFVYYNGPSDFRSRTKKVFTVDYNPTVTGSHEAKLVVKSSGGLSSSKKTIKLIGTVIDPSITVSPSSLTFSDATVGKTYTKTFMVNGTDLSTPLTVSWSKNPSGMFYIENTSVTSESNKTTMIVTVAYKPTATGTHTGTITISGGGATSKTVSVKGTCVNSANPTINTSVTAFTFGTVIKGNSKQKSFTVTGSNLTGGLTVKSNSSYFKVSPTSLPANGGTVTVTYKPTAAGSHSGTITISGGGASNKTVKVTGICVVPTIKTSVSSLHFPAAIAKTFKVTGTNLTGSLTVKSSSSYFTVSPSTITASAAASGKTVTVTCNAPANLQRTSGTITISGGGATSKTVSLSYVKGQDVQINAVEPNGNEDGNEGSNSEFMNGGSLEVMSTATTDVNELAMNSKIYAEGLNIIIETPIEQKALLSDIAGHVRVVDLQAGRNEIPVNASGVYIVRIREKTAKLMLK